MTISTELAEALDQGKLNAILDALDTQRVWTFDEEETRVVDLLLRSDSVRALRKAHWLVNENTRHIEPIIPTLIEIALDDTKGFARWECIDLLCRAMSVVRWRAGFALVLGKGLGSYDIHIRSSAIATLAWIQDSALPEVFTLLTGIAYESLDQARQATATAHNQIDDLDAWSDDATRNLGDHERAFERKRCLRALRIGIEANYMSVAEVKELICDEDSLTFRRLFVREWINRRRHPGLKHVKLARPPK